MEQQIIVTREYHSPWLKLGMLFHISSSSQTTWNMTRTAEEELMLGNVLGMWGSHLSKGAAEKTTVRDKEGSDTMMEAINCSWMGN